MAHIFTRTDVVPEKLWGDFTFHLDWSKGTVTLKWKGFDYVTYDWHALKPNYFAQAIQHDMNRFINARNLWPDYTQEVRYINHAFEAEMQRMAIALGFGGLREA